MASDSSALYWPCGGPPKESWCVNLVDAIPVLAGLKSAISDLQRSEALVALNHIGQTVAKLLQHGPLVVLVEGLPEEWLTNGLADMFYLHVCECIGRLDHVRGPFYDVYDRKLVGRNYVRYSDTNLSHGLHTDSMSAALLPDVVGLLCIRQAPLGGKTRLINIHNVCARLAAQNPEVVTTLYEYFPRQTRSIATGQANPSALNFYPILSNSTEGTLHCRYMRRWIDAGYACAGITAPDAHVAALDAFDRALEMDPDMLSFRMAPGEILFLNNHVILHDRETYQDLDHAPRLMRRAWIYECYK